MWYRSQRRLDQHKRVEGRGHRTLPVRERGERERERERPMAPKRRLSVVAPATAAQLARGCRRPPADASREAPKRRRLLIRAKDRNMDDFTLSQIGRVVKGQIRHCLGPIVSKLESMDGRICALTQKVDNIICNSRNGHNLKRHIHETYEEGNSAEAEGLATNEGKGKRTRIRLRFLDGMKPLIYHEDEIRSESDSAIRIGIYDGNNMIDSGPLSMLKIEILALNGDFPYDASDIWTSEEFNEYRVGGWQGKGNVLAGKCIVRLTKGKVELNNIKFIKGSCNAPHKMFIVGARVCDGKHGQVQEAVMNPVVVQDRRNKSNEKSHPPKLYDRVHRLEEIANGGKYCNRLGKENIFTVQDFLKALNKDPDNLATILKTKKHYQVWKKMVKHAQGCCLEGNRKLKSYRSAEENVVLFFNCVDYLVGANFGDLYTASDMFDTDQKELVDKLKKHAYAKFDGLIDDHVMKDKCPMPIYMDADAGPSYKSSATQKNCSTHFTTYQGERTSAVEGLNHAHIELSCANTNNICGPITGPGTGLVQELNGWCQNLLNCSVGTSEEYPTAPLVQEFSVDDQDYGAPLLPDLEYINVAPGQCFLGSNHTLEPATAAHSNMTLTPQQLVASGAPGEAQGSVLSQVETRLPNSDAYQVSNSAQSSLPQGQGSRFQGNMPWNGSP